MKYRAEIDGLRAFAVLPVILFHAGFEHFSGGFVGVDVFFVISGYLITSILIEELDSNCFSVQKFYQRRARRILPALFFVIFLCIPFSWIILLPTDLLDFCQSLVAVLLFSSNFLFWTESGYFGTAAELKPLLHTWSLAVEEQYYIFFPIFLLLTWRMGKNKIFWTLMAVAFGSLLLSEWGAQYRPSANFFLAPTRAWELLAGSLSAFILKKQATRGSNSLSFLGLTAIIASVFLFDETTPFPSSYALVPVLGAVLVILYGDDKTFVAKILSTKSLVSIGLISYSAYLWHQPLLALYRYKYDLKTEVAYILCAVSIILAYLTWKFVETPFRDKNKVPLKKLVIYCLSGYVIIGSVGIIGIINWKESLTLMRNDPYGGQFERDSVKRVEQYSKNSTSDFIIWGDSFADALTKPMNQLLQGTEKGFLSYIKQSCPSLINTVRNEGDRLGHSFAKSCRDFNEKTKKAISTAENKGKYLILASSYYWYEHERNSKKEPILIHEDNNKNEKIVESSLIETIKWAQNNSLKPIVVLTPPRFFGLKALLRSDDDSAKELKIDINKYAIYNKIIRETLSTTGAMTIDPIQLLCQPNESTCKVYDKDNSQFKLWYDGSHLSEYGGKVVSAEVLRRMNDAQKIN